MRRFTDAASEGRWLWPTAVLVAVAVGVLVRLADPLSTPVIPAEDPYTHMALVQEHVRDGALDPLNADGSMYPPGMHALLGAVWVFSGIDLYTIMRFAPVVFGAIGIVGVALLLARFESKAAGAFGAFAFALAPEVVVRTTMMAPTAVDLALLPFLFYALLNVVEGHLAWTVLAAPLTFFLIVSHPWVFGVLALAGAAFLLLAYLLPWSTDRGPRPDPRGLATAASIVATGAGLTLAGCWGVCGPGFGFVVGQESKALLTPVAYALLAIGAALGGLVVARPETLDRLIPRTKDLAPPRPVVSGLLLLALVGLIYPAVQQGMPPHVDLPAMFGWPLLVVAGLGLIALPYLDGPAAYLGAAIALTTFPFVIFNPFDSPFWSHRTAVYLGIGMALIAAVAVARPARRLASKIQERTSTTTPSTRPLIALVPFLLVGASVGGVWAATPDADENRWYRLYSPCEMDGLRGISDTAKADRSALVLTGDWRPKLVLAALTPNASRVWYMADFYKMDRQDRQDRQGFLDWASKDNRTVIAVVDRHLHDNHPNANTSFLDGDSWETVDTWDCNASTDPPRRIQAYRLKT